LATPGALDGWGMSCWAGDSGPYAPCVPMPAMTLLGTLWNRWLRFIIWLADITPAEDRSKRDDGNGKALLIVFLAIATLAVPAAVALLLSRDTPVWAVSVFTGGSLLFELGLALLSGVRAQRLHTVEHASQIWASGGIRLPGAVSPTAEFSTGTVTQHFCAEVDAQAGGTDVPPAHADAVAILVRAEMDRGVRHLYRMGWLFAGIGFTVTILVVILGPYIPVLKR
jgi:hypothetical protein